MAPNWPTIRRKRRDCRLPLRSTARVDLTPPMVNRLCLLAWEPDENGWDRGTRDGFRYQAPDVPILPSDWRDYAPRW
jgi:hypothetical protein